MSFKNLIHNKYFNNESDNDNDNDNYNDNDNDNRKSHSSIDSYEGDNLYIYEIKYTFI